jgi:hypothetical protein
MTIQKRGFYRIEYPISVQPIMSVRGSTFHILELSEGGGRVPTSEAQSTWFKNGTEVTIEFQCGRSFVTEAKLIRVDGNENVLRFTPPIPLPIIIEEQRLLITQYPKD